MKQFTDTTGQIWAVEITGGTVKRAHALEIDLGDPKSGDPPLALRLSDTDVSFFVDLLCVICAAEIRTRNIEALAFAELLGPETIYDAYVAFTDEWQDFFQKLHRPEKAAAVAQANRFLTQATETLAGVLTGPLMEAKMARDLEGLGASCANLLQLPESTPNPEPSAS